MTYLSPCFIILNTTNGVEKIFITILKSKMRFWRNRLFKLDDVSYFYIWSFWRSSDSVFVKIMSNLIVLRGKQNTFTFVTDWLQQYIGLISPIDGLASPCRLWNWSTRYISVVLISNNCTTPFTPRFVLTGRIFITANVSA